MSGPRDIIGSISMTLAMAKGDKDWDAKTDLSAERVFASFWAIPLAIPAHLVAVEGARRLAIASDFPIPDVSPGVYGLTQTISMVMAWIVEVGVLVSIASRRGAGWKVSPLIIGFNWAVFLSQLAQGLSIGLFLILGQPELAQLAPLIVAVWAIWLYWGVIRRAMETTALGTVGVIVLLILVSTAVRALFTIVYTLTGMLPSMAPA